MIKIIQKQIQLNISSKEKCHDAVQVSLSVADFSSRLYNASQAPKKMPPTILARPVSTDFVNPNECAAAFDVADA